MQGVGGASDFPRVYALAEKLGLLEEGAVPEHAKDPVAEQKWAEQVAWSIAEVPLRRLSEVALRGLLERGQG